MDNEQLNQDIEDMQDDPVDRLLQEKKPSSSGNAVAVLALLLALAAVGASGWLWWQASKPDAGDGGLQQSLTQVQDGQRRLSDGLAAVENRLDAIGTPAGPAELENLAERIDRVEAGLGSLRGQSGQDQATISAVQGSLRSLEQRLSAAESSLISVAASSQNSSEELDIAEIDFLLRVASERLQLFGDPVAADLALQAADVQLDALEDPMFLSVRQRIAAARQALALVPAVDRVALSASLAEMQSEIPALPFRGENELPPEPVLAEDAGWWESFKHTLSSLVTVRRRAPEDEEMLSLDDKDYLRQGLWLQLESARLALMRRDTGVYSGSLDRVAETLEQFFNKTSTRVQALSRRVEDLKQEEIAPAMPDISAPWSQLRQLRDSRRLLQNAPPVEDPPPVENATPVENETNGEESG